MSRRRANNQLSLQDCFQSFVTKTLFFVSVGICAVVGLLVLVLKLMLDKTYRSGHDGVLNIDGITHFGENNSERSMLSGVGRHFSNQIKGSTTLSNGTVSPETSPPLPNICPLLQNISPPPPIEPPPSPPPSPPPEVLPRGRKKKAPEKPKQEDLTNYFPPRICPACGKKSSLYRSLSKCSSCAKGNPSNCPFCVKGKDPCNFCKNEAYADPCPYKTDEDQLKEIRPGSAKFIKKSEKPPCPLRINKIAETIASKCPCPDPVQGTCLANNMTNDKKNDMKHEKKMETSK